LLAAEALRRHLGGLVSLALLPPHRLALLTLLCLQCGARGERELSVTLLVALGGCAEALVTLAAAVAAVVAALEAAVVAARIDALILLALIGRVFRQCPGQMSRVQSLESNGGCE
jgi:hypothetical protein